MTSPQAQSEFERTYWAEEEITAAERAEYEEWLAATYNEALHAQKDSNADQF